MCLKIYLIDILKDEGIISKCYQYMDDNGDLNTNIESIYGFSFSTGGDCYCHPLKRELLTFIKSHNTWDKYKITNYK